MPTYLKDEKQLIMRFHGIKNRHDNTVKGDGIFVIILIAWNTFVGLSVIRV